MLQLEQQVFIIYWYLERQANNTICFYATSLEEGLLFGLYLVSGDCDLWRNFNIMLHTNI